jgi:hypothetical protein
MTASYSCTNKNFKLFTHRYFFARLALERKRMLIKSAAVSTTKYSLAILEGTSRFREKSAQINYKLDNPCTNKHEYTWLKAITDFCVTV